MPTDSPNTIPVHVAIIPDGNRRWAKAKGIPTLEGHRKGFEVALDLAEVAAAKGVKYLTFYTFSAENWNRAEEEVGYLMDLLRWVFKQKVKKLHTEGFRIRFFGSRDRLDADIVASMEETTELTKNNTYATLNLCLNYGGRQDILEATKRLVADGLSADQVTPEALAQRLSSAGTPDVDLLIRTSGEQRLSNLLLWESAYAELIFVDVLWPDYNEELLEQALREYASRQRRFGQ
jgi:undecaprenyl diphosphate synthase